MLLRHNAQNPLPSNWLPFATLTLALIALLSALYIARSAVPAISLPTSGQAASGPSFTAQLPDRSFSYLYATGTTTGTGSGGSKSSSGGGGAGPAGITDSRLNANVPGTEALLTAIYPGSNGSFTVWWVDPTTGNGTFAFRVLRGAVDRAMDQAAETGASVLIAPATPGTLPAVYATADGECLLYSMYPDGKPAQVTFAC